jgi:crotonobetainyl-CoA:carnitine CoA-transferase CaiB-like acyl-CoA transferase
MLLLPEKTGELTMDAPLHGINVVDLTWNLPGPYTSFLLQSLGASVTKVEPPRGDPARSMPGLFSMLNAGKRSVFVDLSTEEGRSSVHELFQKADVVLEGFRPGVAQRLGVSAEQARQVNERLIYCSISAWGQDGPLRDVPGHDLNAQALAGVCHLARDARGVPHGLPLPVADLGAAMSAVSSIVAALYARERDGQGRVLDVAMLDAAVSWASVWGEGVDLAEDARRALPRGRRLLSRLLDRLDRERLHALPHYEVYRCSDGRFLAIGIVDEKHFWKALCEELGSPRMAGLPLPARAMLGPLLKRWVAQKLGQAPAASWYDRLVQRGLPVSEVLSPTDARWHPQVRHRLVGPDGRLRAPLAGALPTTGEVPGPPPGSPRR